MFLAVAPDGERIEAAPNLSATCPCCDEPVIPKCGDIVSWHWAHQRDSECDPWAEPDTAWHRSWQDLVPPERREVVMGPHRADIVTPDGLVVEIQSKSLSGEEIAEREAFYGRMLWIADCRLPVAKWKIGNGHTGLDIRPHEGYASFRWRHARKWVSLPTKRVYLDCGKHIGLLELRKFYPGPPCGGWGIIRSYEWMAELMNRDHNPGCERRQGEGTSAPPPAQLDIFSQEASA